jgi:hypothetical protein
MARRVRIGTQVDAHGGRGLPGLQREAVMQFES